MKGLLLLYEYSDLQVEILELGVDFILSFLLWTMCPHARIHIPVVGNYSFVKYGP